MQFTCRHRNVDLRQDVGVVCLSPQFVCVVERNGQFHLARCDFGIELFQVRPRRLKIGFQANRVLQALPCSGPAPLARRTSPRLFQRNGLLAIWRVALRNGISAA